MYDPAELTDFLDFLDCSFDWLILLLWLTDSTELIDNLIVLILVTLQTEIWEMLCDSHALMLEMLSHLIPPKSPIILRKFLRYSTEGGREEGGVIKGKK